jgi:energy-coupling factor transport system permease protein
MQELQYRRKDTPIHRLNPLVKLAWGLAIVVLSLLLSHPFYILAIFLCIALVMGSARVFKEWSTLLKFGVWLGVAIIIINAVVSYQGEHVLLSAPFTIPVIGKPAITLEAIAFGAMMALKIIVIISAFAFINLTVHPDDVMSVLIKAKIPYRSVLVVSLATRFIPCLIEDVGRISDAYRTRGVQLDAGNRFRRIRNRATILIPLLTNSLDRAVQVAEAMEARAFGALQKRVFYKPITISPLDFACLIAAILPLVLGIVICAMGSGSYEFYPTLSTPWLSSQRYALLVMMSICLVAILPLAILKKRVELDQI